MNRTFLSAFADPVFSVRVTPEAAVAHPAWRRAQAAALQVLAEGSHAVVVGPPGSGKSLLLRSLAHALRQAGTPAHLVGQDLATGDAHARSIPLVDDADRLGTDTLAVLCAGAGPVVLAMLPGGPGRLPIPCPARSIVLDPLTPEEVAAFVAARLAAAGRPAGLLEPEAVLALAVQSAGLPRMVNVLGTAAVCLATLDGSPRVGPRHVAAAAALRDDPANDEAARSPRTPAMLFPGLPSPRAALLRRRAALGGMVAASGALFALPWLAPKLPGGVAQAGADQAQPSQPEAAHAEAARPDAAPVDLAHEEATPSPDAAPTVVADNAAPGLPGQPGPEVQAVADAAPPPRAVPAPPAEPALPAAHSTVAALDAPVLFRGPIFNETMGQGGYVRVVLHKQAPTGAITARFDASQGLSGTGTLAGRVSDGGRITASGQLLMGRNPFLCDFRGTLDGNRLTGSASFVRSGSGVVYRSRFSLVRT